MPETRADDLAREPQPGTDKPGASDTVDHTGPAPGAESADRVPDPDGPPGPPGGSRRGRFSVIRPHARGGLGQVSLAQDEELNRTVALKELRPDRLGSAQARRRFLIEAEITGRLEHPGIIPVHALGRDAAGNPYYAMRFVHGCTLDDAISAYHRGPTTLAFRDLLQRFVTVCRTVAYAHSRRVIHRDLKPANIMIGEYGETLVLDWGLAKVLLPGGPSSGPGAGDTAPDDGGEGSPDQTSDYVSSEGSTDLTEAGQVLGTPAYMSPEQAAGDTAGTGPAADVYALGAILYRLLVGRSPYEGNSRQVLEQLRTEPPPAPRAVSPRVPPALDAVCLRAMARAAPDRYATAQELAEEVERYLAGEPVRAYPEPWAVRAGRWVRRNRLPVTGLVALLTAAVPLLVLLALTADTARRKAQADKQTLDVQFGKTQVALDRAVNARTFFEQAVFLAVRPKGLGLGKDVTVKELLDATVPKIGPAFADYPEDEAGVRLMLGLSYADLGHPDRAEPLMRRSLELRQQVLGPEHFDTLHSLRHLGRALTVLGRYDDAVALLDPALPVFNRVLGEEHLSTREAMSAVATALGRQRRFPEAEAVYRRRLATDQRVSGAASEEAVRTQIDLGGILLAQGKLAEAEGMLRPAWERNRERLGEDHPITSIALVNLAAALQLQNKRAEAEPILRLVVAQQRRISGDEHPNTLRGLHNLATLLRDTGDGEEAEALYREALRGRRKALSPDHPVTRGTQYQLADLLRARGKLDDAEPLVRELLAMYQTKPAAGTSGPAPELMLLGGIRLARGEAVEAEKLLREALAVYQKDKPQGDNATRHAASLLGGSLTAQKRFAEAEPLLLTSVRDFQAEPAVPPWQLREAVTRLVRLYEQWGKPDAADRWRTELQPGTGP